MDNRNRIKAVIAAEGSTLKAIITELNARNPENETTAQAVTNKLARDTIRLAEAEEILDILGYDVIFRNRATKKEY